MMDAKKRERIDSQVMTAMNRGETSRNGKPVTGKRCCVGLWCGVSN